MQLSMIQQDTNPQVAATFRALDDLFGDLSPRDFAVVLWDGSVWEARTDRPRFTVRLNHPGALRRMFAQANDLSLGEAYIHGDFDIEGELEDVFATVNQLLEKPFSLGEKIRLAWDLHHLPKRDGTHDDGDRRAAELNGRQHDPARDREAISYHYDVSNEFYQLFLDKRMAYSCAYFEREDESVDIAQARKLDYLCRKLRLKKGEAVLDIGCGWGGLMIHAAMHYGVHATGVTLSERQAELANRRIREAGLEDRCQVQVRDYREIAGEGVFDKIVSVGMVEHVGVAQLPTYFACAYRLLKPGGVFVNHGITRSAWVEAPKGPNFIHAYVFPDGDLMPIHVRLEHAERAGFEVRDVEDLREHYAMTLRQWVQRLQANRHRAIELVGDVTYRVWELFMAGSAHNFAAANLNLYQSVLSKVDPSGRSGLPLTRADWYAQANQG